MKFSIDYNGVNYPLHIHAKYQNGGVEYSSMTHESYECLDGVRRNFGDTGSTLSDCMANTLVKIITYQPQ